MNQQFVNGKLQTAKIVPDDGIRFLAQNVLAANPEERSRLMRLLFVGDVMIGRLVNDALTHEAASYPWGDTLGLFRHADWRICNLECAISDRGTPWRETPKRFHFRTDAKNVDVLKAAQIDCVSLANNHALDFGYDALEDTVRILSEARILHAGGGPNARIAQYAPRIDIAGLKVGFVAFTDNMPVWEATADKAGVYFVPVDLHDPRMQQLLRKLRAIRDEVDLLIISAHWGPNWGYDPPAEHRVAGHAFIDHGADIVFGHSAHICRGIEIYKRRPILYSTGDFIDDYAIDPAERNDRSFIFCVDTDGAEITRIDLHPTIIGDFQARRARGEDRNGSTATMARLCEALGTQFTWNDRAQCLRIEIAEHARTET